MYTGICETRKFQRRQFLELGFIFSLMIHIGLFLQGNKRLELQSIVKDVQLGPIKTFDIPKTIQKKKLNPPPKPTISIPSEQEMFHVNIPIPVWDFKSKDHFSLPELPNLKEEVPIKFIECYQKPYPIGGFSAIGKHLKYPERARKLNIEGIVKVKVLLDEKGNIIDTKIVKSLGPYGCDEEAVRAVRAVKWIPAMQRDRPVKVWVEIPIFFKLN